MSIGDTLKVTDAVTVLKDRTLGYVKIYKHLCLSLLF